MATKDYSKTAQTALKLITKFGLTSSFVRNEAVNTKFAAGTPNWVSYPTQAVKVPASQRDVVFLPENTVVSKTAKILMEAVGMTETPQIADKVNHNGKDYQIIAIKPLSPADVDVMWTVYVQV